MPRYYKNYLYNEHERKGIGIITRQNQLMQELRQAELGKLKSPRDLAEKHKAQFEAMHIKSLKNRDKV